MKKFSGIALLVLMLIQGCRSQKSEASTNDIVISHGTYEAVVDDSNVEDELRAFNKTSKIGFSFEADQKFVYMVRAMGREIDDVGKWEIRGDSLHIFDLERGPNTAFYIQELGPEQYRISGPNVFKLTKVAEMTPIQN